MLARQRRYSLRRTRDDARLAPPPFRDWFRLLACRQHENQEVTP